jgi:hypothetical protein
VPDAYHLFVGRAEEAFDAAVHAVLGDTDPPTTPLPREFPDVAAGPVDLQESS